MDATFIRGLIPAMITPMTENEDLDEAGLKDLIDQLIDRGVHGIFTIGTAGEFWALTVEEKKRVFEWTVQFTDKRVPTYVGTCANSTREAVQLAEYAQESGVDCLSVLTPSFITPDDDQMFAHFSAIAKSVDVPILLYNLPDRTGNRLSVDVVVRLAETFENIVGIKDSSGDLTNTLEYQRRCPESFRLIMGRDTLIYSALAHGMAGGIAASANVAPEIGVGIYENFIQGNLEEAQECQQRLAPLRLAFSLGTHPAMLKAGAELVGFPAGPPRAPVSPLTEPQREHLKQVLIGMGYDV